MHENILSTIQSCVIIPTYNNEKTLERVILKTLNYTSDVIIVNDGSTDSTREILQKFPELHQIHFPKNQGKGMALRAGFKEALKLGYHNAITIDSDGQHFPEDFEVFINEIQENGEALLIGDRNMEQDGIPGKSSFGNRISTFWYWFETGIKLHDTQSGFRLYPIKRMESLKYFTRKFEFEIEVIVKADWDGIPVKNVPIQVLYDESERVSHFRPFKDFTRISLLNTYLVFLTIFYIKPRDYFRSFQKKGFKRFFLEDLLHSEDSKTKKSLSVALGVFIGIAPLWGFQTVIVLFLAYILRLNKLISFAFSNISIPPMIPIIIYASMAIGNFIVGKPKPTKFQWDALDSYKEYITLHLTEYFIGSIILAISTAILFGIGSYFLLGIRKDPQEKLESHT
jgi:glycosyltransferase involved in cell wall biosynthesis